MNRFILSVVTLLVFGFARAQQPAEAVKPVSLSRYKGQNLSSGDVILMGAIGFSQVKSAGEKTVVVEFTPSAAYFVSNHFAVGIGMGFSMTNIDDGDEIGSNATDARISIGPLVRYYRSPQKQFSFFGQFSFMYNSTISNSGTVGETDFKTNGYEIEVAPGVSYFISKNFALEASVGAFKTQSIKSDLEEVPSKYIHTSSIDLSAVNVGLIYKF